MKIKKIVDEWYQDYKLPSMYICAASCTFKCEQESGVRCCQNSALAKRRSVSENTEEIIERYLKNPITKAVVFGGLEPFDQSDEILQFITLLRDKYHCNDTVVIYTGYNKKEVLSSIKALEQLRNIIIKFGRFIPNQTPHYDEILGVNLASDNQYAEKIS